MKIRWRHLLRALPRGNPCDAHRNHRVHRVTARTRASANGCAAQAEDLNLTPPPTAAAVAASWAVKASGAPQAVAFMPSSATRMRPRSASEDTKVYSTGLPLSREVRYYCACRKFDGLSVKLKIIGKFKQIVMGQVK
jgi:hypothetical protein